MSPGRFDLLLRLVGRLIVKQTKKLREPISAIVNKYLYYSHTELKGQH